MRRLLNELRQRRQRGDRGAALVEAALVMPVVVLLIFGVIEYGFLYGTAQTANSSTRAGARQAAQNFALATTAAQANAEADQVRDAVVSDLLNLDGFGVPVEMWIYKADAAGDYVSDPTFTTCAASCIRFSNWNGTTFTGRSGSWFANGGSEGGVPDACGPTVDSVGIYTRVQHTFIAGVFGSGQTVNETTVMRFEPKQDGTCPAGAT